MNTTKTVKVLPSFLRKYGFFLCLVLLFSLAFSLRLGRITQVPDITHMDEAGLGYNAWCIAHYGVDRYLNAFPIYPQNFGFGGQSPLYTYLVALLVRTIGAGHVSLLLVRLPGVLFSMLTALFGTWTMAMAFQNRKITLMSAFLLSVCPYFIMNGRVGLDCNLMLGCTTIAICLLFRYLKTQKIRDLLLYSISFGIVMYSYALSYFVVPIFLCLATLYMLFTRKISFCRALLSGVIVCITALPILLFILSLLCGLPPFSFLGMTIAPIGSSRVSEITGAGLAGNVLTGLKMSLTHSTYSQDAVPGYWTLYPVSVPFIAAGLLAALRKVFTGLKNRAGLPGKDLSSQDLSRSYDILFLLYLGTCFLTIGLAGSPQIYRMNYLYIGYLYFLVRGIAASVQMLPSPRKWIRPCFQLVISCCYLAYALAFIRYYFTVYSISDITAYPNSLYMVPANDAIADAAGRPDIQDIYIDYIGVSEYLSFYFPVSPYEIVETASQEPYGDYQLREGYGRYHFIIDGDTPLIPGNAYIAHRDNQAFQTSLEASPYPWKQVEYPHYYLYYTDVSTE